MPGIGIKPEDAGKARKRKFQHERGAESEPEDLGQVPRKKFQEGTEIVFREPGDAQKTTPQEQQHPDHQEEEPGRGHVLKLHEESPRKQKVLQNMKEPPEQAQTERKPTDGGTGRKRPHSSYSILEENDHPTPQKKHRRLPPDLQCVDHVRADPHRPDLPETSAQSNLDSGSRGTLLPDKTPVLAANKKPLGDKEKGREVDRIINLTQEMEEEIKKALGPGPLEDILSSRFKLQVTREDIQTLESGRWLNDDIINFYLNLLVERNEEQGYPALHVFSTFFYPKLKHSGYSSVKRWTRGVDIFEKEVIIVPIHQQVHWSLVVIDIRKQNIAYLDSMGQSGNSICETIFQYLQNESRTRRNIELDPLEWKRYSMTSEEIPQQLNGSDCGVFTCKYADYIARDQPVTFTQQDMPFFRKKMVWEILHSHLL
ncbi:sentrin-specific protease 2-like [Apodemus sylvaticus]|uniref:sentrin-specific protease 2-like n=1 Tax=Apodemus sylvaticus TaxID=10129 RepID=UPI0022438B56|nr:sentrin-specific protease 2-like [Apodemus sylvaticus]